MRAGRALVAFALVGATLLGSGASAETGYLPPYQPGPSGGDEFNFVNSDPSTGSIMLGRLFVEPAVVSCGGNSAYVFHRAQHRVTSRVTNVRVDFTDAITDGFTWVVLNVRDQKGTFLGAAELRGPLLQNGSIATFLKPVPPRGTLLTIDAGARMSSSCPGAGGGMLTIAAMVVS